MSGVGGFLAASQGPGGLDPETWEELRRGIDQRYPTLSPEARRDILRRIEATPKVRCTIEAVTVYTDGIVCRATLSSDLPFDCRMSFLGRLLSPVCMARLTDGDKNEWGVPPLMNHYSFDSVTEEWSVPIPRGKGVQFLKVDRLETPRLVRLQPPADGQATRPAGLQYAIACYGAAYTADLKKRDDIYWFGRGKTLVEWNDGPIPPGSKSGLINPQNPPKAKGWLPGQADRHPFRPRLSLRGWDKPGVLSGEGV
jgi:hypothetical protein